jgi:hypothetical protein
MTFWGNRLDTQIAYLYIHLAIDRFKYFCPSALWRTAGFQTGTNYNTLSIYI